MRRTTFVRHGEEADHLGSVLLITWSLSALFVLAPTCAALAQDAKPAMLAGVFGEAANGAGSYDEAAELVAGKPAANARITPPERFQSFTRRLPISITNPLGRRRKNEPVVLSLKTIQAEAEDFNPHNCAVVAPKRQIDRREIPHQVDQIDATAGPELSFLAHLPPDGQATYYLYWSPEGKREKTFQRKTGTDQNWDPGKLNVGWESNLGAYRTYDGMFDFFGKHTFRHGKKVEWLIYPIKSLNYHQETEWGVDALLVGTTSGIGGLTLYADERAWPVHNPGSKGNVKFTKRMLGSGPIRAAVEVTAENIIPELPHLTVRLLCLIYAEHQESEIRATVRGESPGALLAPGLTRLVREEVFVNRSIGCLGSWGFQDDTIGEIGMALIVPPEGLDRVVELPHERRVLCRPSQGTLRYWILGDWRRGRPLSVAPTVDNWRRQVEALARRVHDGVRVTIQVPEQVR